MSAPKFRVVIADDEFHSREFLKALINTMNGEVVGEATTGVEAVDLYTKLRPHLLLMDVNMPIMTGDEALQEIKEKHPDAFVIMMSAVADRNHVKKCFALGASHYIRKDTPLMEIKRIIKEAWEHMARSKPRGQKPA
ncbi:MAG: response regulator transcription factor [Acidobacteriota bacterium]